MGGVGAGWGEVLHNTSWLSVECGLDQTITIHPDSSVKKVNFSGLKIVVGSFLALKLDGGVEVQ